MLSRNALIIIPFVAFVWFIGARFGREAPFWFQLSFFVVVGFMLLAIFVFLMTDTGWRTLARAYRVTRPFEGKWHLADSANISRVSIRDPAFGKNRTRLSALLRVGATDEALYLSTPFSRIPLVNLLMPAIQVPWSAIRLARVYKASGYVNASAALQSAARRRAAYDPGYTGDFVELVIGTAPVFMQLPLDLLGAGKERLALAASA